MHHKRHRPKHRRAGCLFCKPHKRGGHPRVVRPLFVRAPLRCDRTVPAIEGSRLTRSSQARRRIHRPHGRASWAPPAAPFSERTWARRPPPRQASSRSINSLRCGSTRGLSCVDDGNRVRGRQRGARLHDRPMQTWKQTRRPTRRYVHSRGCSRDKPRARCSSVSRQAFTRIAPPMRAGNESRHLRPLLLREPAGRIDR